ncbi:MAG: hypothetical protein FWE33_01815 [Defluviitaleaceae bacterium]|nr:hypothetical protein [Defluviitaleaceae bacterium]
MKRSKSTLLLIEQIIVIAIFAFCAAVSVSIISSAYLITQNSVDARNALAVAESAAESFKAFGGDADKVVEMINRDIDENFSLDMTVRDDGGNIVFADIVVIRVDDGEELVTLTAAARRGVR